MKFTVKQRKFIEYYNGNASEAARLAGYSKKTAYSIGNFLLKNIEISRAIKRREEKRNAPKIASRQERQEFWSEVFRADDEDMRNRLKAAELLGRSEADFTDNHNLTVDDKFLEAIRKTDTNRLKEMVCQLN